MSDFGLAALLLPATLAAATIPLGGLLGRTEALHPGWLDAEWRHAVLAFGGGVLVAAVALVLVPEGSRALPPAAALAAFGAGGLAFFLLDRLIERRGGAVGMLLALMVDFLPESLALGAMLAEGAPTALLMAVLIGLQNLPEGFNAYRELAATGRLAPGRILALFVALALLGPLAALAGWSLLAGQPGPLGAIMLFAGGGILYLTFQDIAPQVPLERHWAPPLGAVAGFMLGLAGHLLLT